MRTALASMFAILFFSSAVRAEWQRTDTTLAWVVDGDVVWRFSFDPKAGKPFFDPVSVAGGASFTNFKPEDHPWHYGLWFSWKYINQANYWEESRQTGRSEGATRWSSPSIDTQTDGSAAIRLTLTYSHPSGRIDVTERRELRVSAPAHDGSYSIDWHAHFTMGPEEALFDRTPMLGEPDGRVNGGYAGLGVRLAGLPVVMSVVTPEGPVEQFTGDRARPNAVAIGCNFSESGRDLGGLAIVSDPAANGGFGDEAPWYIVKSQQMHFACAAVLAPKPRQFAADATWDLHYRVLVGPKAWTPESLRAASR